MGKVLIMWECPIWSSKNRSFIGLSFIRSKALLSLSVLNIQVNLDSKGHHLPDRVQQIKRFQEHKILFQTHLLLTLAFSHL